MFEKETQADQEIDERLHPGTVRLIDKDGTVLTKHAKGKGEKDVILVPHPSEDPEDPLNWSFKRKVLSTSCVIMYTIMVCIPSSAVYSVVTPIRKGTSLDLTDINNGTGIMFLFYGWGCIFWQPIALQYGKRGVYLGTTLATVLILALAPKCTTTGPYLAIRILQGFFGAPVESLPEISLTDIWFTHERPKYLAWYGWALAMTGKLAPMLSGFINVGMGWKWTLWWCSIFNAIAFVYCFIFMEETNYDRTHRSEPVVQDVQETSVDADGKTFTAQPTATAPSDQESGEIQWPRKTFWDKLGIKDKPRPNRIIDIMIAPFKGFTYPAVVYGGLMYGTNNLIWTGVQNATIGTVYTTQYGFSTAGVAGGYAGGVIGCIIGGLYSGWVGPRLAIRMARRNNGISEPEHVLWLFAAGCILCPFALIFYGVAVHYHFHWFAIVSTQVAVAINSTLCVSAALNYAISSYHELSGQMITTCILIRNTLSFAINYGITPWIHASGYLTVYSTMGVIGFLCNASFLLMLYYGRTMREKTAGRYWRDVDRARAKGLGH